jgi:hypothetical protein
VERVARRAHPHRQADGSTLIRGSVVDQSALFGILHKLRDVALPLVSVMYIAGTSTP